MRGTEFFQPALTTCHYQFIDMSNSFIRRYWNYPFTEPFSIPHISFQMRLDVFVQIVCGKNFYTEFVICFNHTISFCYHTVFADLRKSSRILLLLFVLFCEVVPTYLYSDKKNLHVPIMWTTFQKCINLNCCMPLVITGRVCLISPVDYNAVFPHSPIWCCDCFFVAHCLMAPQVLNLMLNHNLLFGYSRGGFRNSSSFIFLELG